MVPSTIAKIRIHRGVDKFLNNDIRRPGYVIQISRGTLMLRSNILVRPFQRRRRRWPLSRRVCENARWWCRHRVPRYTSLFLYNGEIDFSSHSRDSLESDRHRVAERNGGASRRVAGPRGRAGPLGEVGATCPSTKLDVSRVARKCAADYGVQTTATYRVLCFL